MTDAKELVRTTFYAASKIPFRGTLLAPWRGMASILMYHRVVPDAWHPEEDRTGNSFSLSQFAAHMDFLSRKCTVVSIDDLTNPETGSKDRNRVAITFDDGYRDNLEYALPILRKFQFPATIYVVTGFMEHECSPWWYELQDLLAERQSIDITFDGHPIRQPLRSPSDRKNAFQQLSRLLTACSRQEQERFLSVLREGRDRKDYSHMTLTWADVMNLANDPSITIGAHTHTHPRLARLAEVDVLDELLTSKRLLEVRLGRTVAHLAYPFGTRTDCGGREQVLARKCGFKTAVTTTCGVINTHTDPFALPRHVVAPWHASLDRLEAKIVGWNALWRRHL